MVQRLQGASGEADGSAANVGPDTLALEASLEALKARHPDVEIVASIREGGLALSMIRVPRELQGQGRASAALRDLVRWADHHGQTMALTPERASAGASDNSLRAWYRRHGFVPNRGRNKDFAFVEAMIRRPREVERTAVASEDPGSKQRAVRREIVPLDRPEPSRLDAPGFEV